ncbi:MAG: M28 family peptidase [Flavobacteriales bacterium]
MNLKTFFFYFFSFVLLHVLNAQNDSLVYNEDQLLMHLKTLSSDAFEGRRTGSDGGIKTKKYIINQFHSLGVLPLGKTYEQSFAFVEQRINYKATNILGLIKGTKKPNEYIVISAHYDHEGIKDGTIYNGADDNASGLCALFSFAEYFKNNPPKHSVILAAFDAEELGLRGSKYYVENAIIPLNKIKINLNLDMISRSDNKELFVVGTSYHENLKQLILKFKTFGDIKLTAGHDGGSLQENWTYSSDHASFYRNNIPFLYFGVADHKDYHQPTDDFENIQPQFYVEAVRTIISIFKNIDMLKL